MRLCLRLLVVDVFQENHLQQIHFPQKTDSALLDCIYCDVVFLNLSDAVAVDFSVSELGTKK